MTSRGEYRHVEMLRAYAEVEASLNVIDKVIDALPIEFRWLACLVGSSTIAPEAAGVSYGSTSTPFVGTTRVRWDSFKAVRAPIPGEVRSRVSAGYPAELRSGGYPEKELLPDRKSARSSVSGLQGDAATVVSADTALHEAAFRAEVATPITLAIISQTFRQSFEVFIPF